MKYLWLLALGTCVVAGTASVYAQVPPANPNPPANPPAVPDRTEKDYVPTPTPIPPSRPRPGVYVPDLYGPRYSYWPPWIDPRRRTLPRADAPLMAPDSPAAQAGLAPGDVIREVNRMPVQDLGDVEQGLRRSGSDPKPVLLRVEREGSQRYIVLGAG